MVVESLNIAGTEVAPGSRARIELPLPPLYLGSSVNMPVTVIHGKQAGLCLFVSAAVHGDELNGTQIIRRLLDQPELENISGTLIAVPVVNVYGVITSSRYLPDRRDLNRCFPGTETGSLASRLAHIFMQEIVSKCTHGIDLHTGAINRTNLPQIRGNLDDQATEDLAKAFNTPVVMNSPIISGSLRQAAAKYDIPVLIYEAGEALRYDEVCIRAGLKGVLNVMHKLEMIKPSQRESKSVEPNIAQSSAWLRANASGMFRKVSALGNHVKKGEVVGYIDDPFSGKATSVTAVDNGIVIGCIQTMLVHEGDALFHIARFEDVKEVAEKVDQFQTKMALELAEEAYEPPIV